jgi:hypothetical protein
MDEEPRTCPQIRRLLAARGPGRGLRRISVAMSHGETSLAYGGSSVPPPLRAQPRLGTRWGGLFWGHLLEVLGRSRWRCVRRATVPGCAELRRLYVGARAEATSGCRELIYAAAGLCLWLHSNLVSTPSPRPGSPAPAPGRVRHFIAFE